MKNFIFLLIALLALLIANACKENKNEDAIKYLAEIQSLYQDGKYPEALSKIDSIQKLFPKAFPEIKDGMALKNEVRRAYDQQQIAICDSLLANNQPKIDSIKKFFVYQKDKEDDKGVFIPKTVSNAVLTGTMLRAGVQEEGEMYIESVFIGSNLHNVVEAKAKDGSIASTKPIQDEGFNFRWNHMGKQYEIMKVTKFHDNGLADFIINNAEKPLTITLKGKGANSFALSNIQKKAITDSYQLAKMLVLQDSLSTAKEKATYRIKYLDQEKQKDEEQKLLEQKTKS